MPPPDSSEIDAALIGVLNGDPTLLALLPQYVWFDDAPPSLERFGLVTLEDAVDEPRFGGRSHEGALYLVRGIVLSTEPNAGSTSKQAAARIDALLEGASLTATGFTPMACYREARVRYTETDEVNPAVRYFHRGARYRVVMSCNP